MARLGRTGLVLTDLPAFIVASSADRQLAPAPALRPSGRADGIGKIRIGFEDNAGQAKRNAGGRVVGKRCESAWKPNDDVSSA